jgi:hypothetical protein
LLIDTNDPTTPWELCHDGQEFLFIRAVVGRMTEDVRTENIPQALVPVGERLACLIIAPSTDLKGAQEEAQALNDFFQKQSADVVCLRGEAATYVRVSGELLKRRYHLIHICGHADFDRDNNAFIALTGRQRLMAEDIKAFLQGQPLVLANTCVSGQVAMREQRPDLLYSATTAGLPFAFMDAENGRASAFIGTPWRIEDVGASELSLAFYKALFSGKTVGEALQAARKEARGNIKNATWASFVLWGFPGLRLLALAEKPVDKPSIVPPTDKPTVVLPPDQPIIVPPMEEEAVVPPPGVELLWQDGRLNRKRLSAKARQVLDYAESEVVVTEAYFITTTHFFIGLTKIEKGVTQAALHHQGFNPEDTRDMLRGHAREQAEQQLMQKTLANLLDEDAENKEAEVGFSDSVTTILNNADQSAQAEAKHAGLIEERDLLLGFLKQGGGTTRKILEQWEIDLKALQAQAQGQPTPIAQHPLCDATLRLRPSRLAADAQSILERAWQEAHRGMVSYLATPYLVEALFEQGQCLRAGLEAQQCDLQVVYRAVHEMLHSEQSDEARPLERTELYLYDLSRRVQRILRLAHESARGRTNDSITEPDLVLAFLKEGGGGFREILPKAGVDLATLETFVRKQWLPSWPVSPTRWPPLFLPNDQLNRQAFDDGGWQALALAVQEMSKLGVEGFDTRRLVLGLAGLPGGALAGALAQQGWPLERLRRQLQGDRTLPLAASAPDKLTLTRRHLSQSVIAILEAARARANQQQVSAMSEAHIALAFLDSGARWSQGGLGDLGVNLQRLREDLTPGAARDRPSSRTSSQPVAWDKSP